MARFGGGCPRWTVHQAFRNPGQILTQLMRMPDNCRLCTRLDCTQRAFPPLNHRLVVDENIRGLSSYIGPPTG
ncbi:short-chain fatty acyl-CoA regulator family protein [Nitrospirillum iridis]|uniref:Putative transcriptional regulator n=1 Tax=Nitrospirillum iridis TaxID=765888 RepID=A0A7X0EF61_9PROT|nr:putative transcriptional regulator [Nitrospirillum iridis]